MPEKSVDQQTPGVLAPPPLIFLITLTVGGALHYLLPLSLGGEITGWFRLPIGFGLGVAGAVAAILAVRGFRRAGTPAPPWKATTTLVTAGIYSVTRNPMYLGLVLLQIAFGLLADSLWVAAMAIPLAMLLHYGVILREEQYLERRFGKTYRHYRRKVRRWL